MMPMKRFMVLLCGLALVSSAQAQRTETLLEKGWRFAGGDRAGAEMPDYDDRAWEQVRIPHDWAIFGPFDRSYDLQTVTVTQDLETHASVKTGRTGGLPYMGVGWYRTEFSVPAGMRATLLFDGAMSEARVWVNGHAAGEWPCGYNSFYFDVTPYIHDDGRPNTLAVRLENKPESSRWYPGAGLYRNVRVIATGRVHVPVWGTRITTPHVEEELASVMLQTRIVGADGEPVRVVTRIVNAAGETVDERDETRRVLPGEPFVQHFVVERPRLWSPESPELYVAESEILLGGRLVDRHATRFGIRDVRIVPGRGFCLNGRARKFQGVCNHHDLGPLGAAVNRSALRRQLTLLKQMGCDAIRTSHNMPAPELVELCDEMGFMMMIEPFDEWDIAKCGNGYHRFFGEWAERDMVNMLRHYRNHPCVVMWSIGNEVPSQCSADGYRIAKFLQEICHREDPTRPVTCGMDQVTCVLENGFAALLDVPGLNYRTGRYAEAWERLPQRFVLGSETASTVSSRGVYKFPVELRKHVLYDDHQSSGYDVESCSWSNVPDVDFALAEDHSWTLGQFVWTGFDYLGEPSPYSTDAWPSHSSLFGIIDLASLPKDRYWLYRSYWNRNDPTLHVVPHWTWPGREGETTPVFVYTSWPEAELFVNGRSCGRQRKLSAAEAAASDDPMALLRRYRLMWMDTRYEPGELRVVAYDAEGRPAEERTVRTAGRPARLELVPDRSTLAADGKDLAYITVRVVDRDGNLCPHDTRRVSFRVKGAGRYRAAANGDATSLDLFHLPQMPAFGGMLTAIVESGDKPGMIEVEASAPGVKSGHLTIAVR